MAKKVKLNLEISYGVEFPEEALEQLMHNVADALENHVHNVGLAPEGHDVLTKEIKVVKGNWEVKRIIY